MSKADALLKRATFFERMALYSDRKSFLRALAQVPVTIDKGTFAGTFGNDARQQLESVMQDLSAFRVDPSITNVVSTALNTLTGVDKDGLVRALQAAAAKYPPQASGQLQNLQSLIAKLSGPTGPTAEQQDDAAGGEHVTMPADHIKAFPPIDRDAQGALFRIVTIDGDGLPGKVDGLLGPETKKAINALKKRYNLGNTLSDAQVLTYAKMKAANDPKYKS
jgi:hypothetical protein